MRKNIREVVIVHQRGLGEFFICNGLVNKISEHYDRIWLPVNTSVKPSKLATVSQLYSANDKIKLLQWEIMDALTDEEYCERFGIPVLHVNAWKNRPKPNRHWYKHYYEQFNIPWSYRYTHFRLPCASANSELLFKKLAPATPYRLIHNGTSETNYHLAIDYSNMTNVYVTPEHSENLLDWILLITHAQEIHVTPSSMWCLIDGLNISAHKFFHDIRATNAPIDHEDLKSVGWNIVDYEQKY